MAMIVRYFDRRMLATIDLSSLFLEILKDSKAGESITFVPMTNDEMASAMVPDSPINGIRDRFTVWEVNDDEGVPVRRRDIERNAVHLGVK